MGGGEDIFGDVVGQGPEKRNALGRSESQVKPVHTRVAELAAGRAVRRLAVVQPYSDVAGIGVTPLEFAVGQAGRPADRVFVADDKPSGDAGFALQ